MQHIDALELQLQRRDHEHKLEELRWQAQLSEAEAALELLHGEVESSSNEHRLDEIRLRTKLASVEAEVDGLRAQLAQEVELARSESKKHAETSGVNESLQIMLDEARHQVRDHLELVEKERSQVSKVKSLLDFTQQQLDMQSAEVAMLMAENAELQRGITAEKRERLNTLEAQVTKSSRKWTQA